VLFVTDPRVGQSTYFLPSELSTSFKQKEDVELIVNKILPSSFIEEEEAVRNYLPVRITKEALQKNSA
jgi:hypothetical protein